MKNIFTEKVLLAIIGAIVTISTLLSSYMTIKINQKTEVSIAKIDTLHESVNGKITKLLEMNEKAANLQGRVDLINEQDSIKNKE